MCPLSDGNRQQLSEAALRGLQTYVRQESMCVRVLCVRVCAVCVLCVCVWIFHIHLILLSDHVGTAGQAITQMSYWAPTLSSKAMEDLILYLKVTRVRGHE